MIASSTKCPTTVIPDSHHKRTSAGTPCQNNKALCSRFSSRRTLASMYTSFSVLTRGHPDPPDLPRRDLLLLDRLCG